MKSDSITAASIYHAVDREHPTLLIDEGDNLGLAVRNASSLSRSAGGQMVRNEPLIDTIVVEERSLTGL